MLISLALGWALLRPGSDAVLHMSRIECKWGRTKDFAHLHSIRLMWSTASELGLRHLETIEYLHLVFLRWPWVDQIVVWVLKLSNERQRRRGSQPEEEWLQNAKTDNNNIKKEMVYSIVRFSSNLQSEKTIGRQNNSRVTFQFATLLKIVSLRIT